MQRVEPPLAGRFAGRRSFNSASSWSSFSSSDELDLTVALRDLRGALRSDSGGACAG